MISESWYRAEVPEAPSERALRQRARRFWNWFLEHELECFEQPGQQLTTLRTQFRRVHEAVGVEIESFGADQKRLLLTANGVREALPAVQIAGEEAPPLRLFELTLFRQPALTLDPVSIKDVTLNPFEVDVTLERDGERMGLTLYLPGFDRKDEDRALSFRAACVRMLDMALGEVRVAEQVGFIEFQPRETLSLQRKIPLWQLAEAMDLAQEPRRA